jgi:hypothetical protein
MLITQSLWLELTVNLAMLLGKAEFSRHRMATAEKDLFPSITVPPVSAAALAVPDCQAKKDRDDHVDRAHEDA